jgi:hypothetical protein
LLLPWARYRIECRIVDADDECKAIQVFADGGLRWATPNVVALTEAYYELHDDTERRFNGELPTP